MREEEEGTNRKEMTNNGIPVRKNMHVEQYWPQRQMNKDESVLPKLY